MTEKQLWGGETAKAVDNFPVSGERVPPSVIHWLGRIKAAAARTNAELGLLDEDIAERIGAVRHGTGRTQGIHYETRRRIEQELIGVNTRAPEFVEGERAGEHDR